MPQVQDLQPMTYIMLFLFFGVAWAGLSVLCLAVYIGVQCITNCAPKPPVRRWSKDWESMDREDN